MELGIILSLLFFLLLIIPFNFQIRLFFNALNNFGIFSGWFIGIPIGLTHFKFKDAHSIIIKTRKKKVEKEIKLNDPQLKIYEYFYMFIYKKLSLNTCNFYSVVGTENPMYSGLLGGAFESLTSILFLKVKMSKPKVKITVSNKYLFKKNSMCVAVKINCNISLIDMLISFLKAYKLTRKEFKNERTKRKSECESAS